MNKPLIIGIGNSGRQDDGLGWKFVEEIENKFPSHFDFEFRYQLQVEDAELIAQYNKVIFVDADLTQHEMGYKLELLNPISSDSYTSHELSPTSVLALTQTIYKKFPNCYTLGISGKLFQLKIGLTNTGKANLKKSIQYFEKEIISSIDFIR
jgi:hydrogenase maturation protease